MTKKTQISVTFALCLMFTLPLLAMATDAPGTMLFHLKTSLKRDDAQICVAYNAIWAALEVGMKVNVLIDADAVNTYKVGWLRGKDDIEDYKLPDNLRERLSKEFEVSLDLVPKTYGEYLKLLHEKGAAFFINGDMLVVAKISKRFGDLEKISAKFFKPATVKEMIKMRTEAEYYMVY